MVSRGEENGFSSLLSRFTHPDELVCVTLLANAEGLDLSQLARKIAGAYDPKSDHLLRLPPCVFNKAPIQ